jgi:electron transfer flavoprotein alpha subunit
VENIMTTLVIAEHDNAGLKGSTLNTVTAATQCGGDVHVLVAGSNAGAAAAEAAKIAGVSKVCTLTQHILLMAWRRTSLSRYWLLLLVTAIFWLRQLLTVKIFCHASPLNWTFLRFLKLPKSMLLTFERPIYAGNAIATVQSTDAVKVITVRTTGFDAAAATGGSAAVETISAVADSGKSVFVSREVAKSDRPELTAAKIIVSGGRGMGSADAFKVLEPLADKLGAAMGASRAAVDAGFVPNDWQVGQTGKIVAPQLYIAVGISGAIQHLAGMKDSKTIVAINKDPEAPIFSVADYGIVGDLFEIVPQLVAELG